MSEVLRVGNCSGFYGDRLSAMREMLLGGELDVLTGDYLAELTMLILGRDQLKDSSLGYARTFVRQVEDCLAASPAGLSPPALATIRTPCSRASPRHSSACRTKVRA